jgi:predicted DNA-binding mobile mystery protein A
MRRLQVELLDQKLQAFQSLQEESIPTSGWIRFVRQSIGMSLRQLGERMGITPQSVSDIEHREADGKVTLSTLRDAAEALDMRVVYALVPKQGTMRDIVRRQARRLAEDAVARTSISMSLEEQSVPREELLREVDFLVEELMRKNTRTFWNQHDDDRS